jgi:DNA-directed RNA polymerase specialized sigma24 family protein
MQQRRHEQPDAMADIGEHEVLAGRFVGSTPTPTYAELVTGWDRQEALQTGLAHLGGRCRELLSLIFFDAAEPTYDEISALLGMPKGSIGPTRNRCLSQLRDILVGLGFSSID